ncbi:hypothetical protein DPMN_142839 [Dreissena polymorpha]|uniref:Uncharacterized protein n=1 Tax=Dreissena polymorpha TaxID=45954 RepID=A0A9D4GCF7_DREPO|nr:hypothetical protein DPMN_142839 [Dreissena polymorpha]
MWELYRCVRCTINESYGDYVYARPTKEQHSFHSEPPSSFFARLPPIQNMHQICLNYIYVYVRGVSNAPIPEATDTLHPLLTSLAEDMLFVGLGSVVVVPVSPCPSAASSQGTDQGAPLTYRCDPVAMPCDGGNYRSAVISVPRSGRDTAVCLLWAGSGDDRSSVPAQEILSLAIVHGQGPEDRVL